MIEALLLLACVATLIEGGIYCVRHERARRRAARIVFPPMTTIEVSDEIPF